MNSLLSSNLFPCLVLVFPIRDSLCPEFIQHVIRGRQASYEIDHERRPEEVGV